MPNGKIAIVTGASRGAGKGIAIALGQAGYTVYVTGRTVREDQSDLPGTISKTAEQVSQAGGRGIAVQLDHADDAAVKEFFDRVARDEDQLDILVNNVAAVKNELTGPENFWEKPLHLADILDVGLRSQYVASYFAAQQMVTHKRGFIVFTSSFGAKCYMHGAAYGAQKAGIDKMAYDMAVDFKSFNIATVSIWMGPLLTERSKRAFAKAPDEEYKKFAASAETPEFTGKIISALAEWPELMSVSGETLIGAEIAQTLGLLDAENRQPPSYREMLGAPPEFSTAIIR